jgi:hypothetical protein
LFLWRGFQGSTSTTSGGGDLPLEHNKDVLTQIAHVLTRLAIFCFDEVGNLQGNGVGPLVQFFLPGEDKRFASTVGYLRAFLWEGMVENPELYYYVQIQCRISSLHFE